ncbi:ABC transporter ATP-binding protein [Thauera linaloolentis]|uniref:ABC transporter n=1 Tax=Thauera linaloolentis (strain DSM 12138 / JCM 21573 / CCUG 41526 / CIP 105981 / IAM 15112 / NBRC 102519 / 47Lol) TaxID=1123367 RepID=N6Z7K6_THAL4|nr:ABC transporter ATP-binding protein [Thauera linaloolentis]ENO90313.1 ABC transporter [Thauera linaloolentis 47Lol = DSM 12138]MCM8566198.1 ABC transporter ATP-binding protein [Thauera linaloolentis]
MLEARALRKTLPGTSPRVLFDDLELQVAGGECVAIVGESGVGKSTLLNCLAGLEPLDGGHIEVGGRRIDGLDDDAMARLRREAYGFVFQAFHILPHLTLAQNVALPLWLLKQDDRRADERARSMLARVGLHGRADDAPHTLSGGELQRVAIARALVHGPRLVLADEPTGNLDPARANEVLDLLLDQLRASGAAGVLVTHSRMAAQRADRVLELGQLRLMDITEHA